MTGKCPKLGHGVEVRACYPNYKKKIKRSARAAAVAPKSNNFCLFTSLNKDESSIEAVKKLRMTNKKKDFDLKDFIFYQVYL